MLVYKPVEKTISVNGKVVMEGIYLGRRLDTLGALLVEVSLGILPVQDAYIIMRQEEADDE